MDEVGLRLPSRLRLEFEQELGATDERKTVRNKFEQVFNKDIDTYNSYIKKAFECTFRLPGTKGWFSNRGVDIVTWHYKTRHPTYVAAASSGWFSGQIKFSRLPKLKELEPFPEKKSPYIDIFGKEQSREDKRMGGPICILLQGDKKENTLEIPVEWKDLALVVPSEITNLLKRFPEHKGDEDPLRQHHLERVKKRDPQFVKILTRWMNKVSIERVDELKALNNLMASLKVTLTLLRKRICLLPRSTFLCPAYVAGEEVGGMAFACDKFVSRNTALIGNEVSTSMLSYLRLREDALAHDVVEEKALLDQARNFFIYRLVHDFRHPIDALQSTVKDLSKSFNIIEKQIGHVSNMLDDTMLAFDGRDPQKILKAHRSPDKVSEFLSDVRFFFRRRIEEVGKHLYVKEPNPRWVFNIDRGMLHEIMDNLIANAIEHGGQHIRIEVERTTGKYLIHVKDDGPGVPEKYRENIFRPFFKIAGSIKENISRGRGLAISKELAKAHKGDLRLGRGSGKWKADFVLEIPA